MKCQMILSSFLAAAIAATLTSAAQAAPPESSEYFTDVQQSYVEDATSKSIGQVNMIACIMASMRPETLVNEGAYLALVDEVKCDSEGRSSSSNSGGNNASQATSYTTSTVLSTRASNDEPMIMKSWLDASEDGMQATVYVHSSVSAAATPQNPYGAFRLDFCGKGEGQSSCTMKGFLEGGDGSLSFFQDEDGERITALRLTSVGTTSGSGKLREIRIDGNTSDTQQVLFSYDEYHFLRDNQCFSRDAGDPTTGMSVWRYGLYDSATGERIERSSGFPFEFTADGQIHHGHIGYWGMSLPPEAASAISDGAIIQRVDYDSGDEPTRTDYTLTRAPGKLMKYTRQSRSLAEMDNIPFNTWIGDAVGFYPGAQSNTQYVTHWDQASGAFKVTALVNCGDDGCHTQDLEDTQSVQLAYWRAQGGVQGWSAALGGELFIDLQGVSSPVDAATVAVVNRVQELVYPDEMPTTLYCLRDCPTAASLENYFAPGSSAESPFATGSYNVWGPTQNTVTYAIDAGSGVLKDTSGATVVLTDPEAAATRPNWPHGVRSGQLFTQLAAAECTADSGAYCDYKVSSLDVYYTWETGPNTWNQFAAVKDRTGEFLRFEAPLRLSYTIPAAAQFGRYAGKSIVLEYGGFGDLWGIPGQCVSHVTNEPVSCDSEHSRYVPEFVIPFDAETGRVTSGDDIYLVKWLEREIRFAPKDASACGSLALPADVVLPTADDVKDPSDPDSDTYIGTKPQVDAAPRVIHGVVKY